MADSGRPGLALGAALSAALPLVIGLAVFALTGPPAPVIHDEFSYLLAADTFAHGRLTNPPHPLWRHFETFDVMSRPTFMSRKPPLQGLFLALGRLLTGRPIAGVLLAMAAACAALHWTLRAFVPPRWALAGSALAATHPVLFIWSSNYMGGAAGLLGGALVLGAWRRLRERPRPVHGAVLGAGLAVLANSRPFEGLVLALLLAPALPWRGPARKWVAPALAVLFATAAGMGYDNWRLTGSPLRTAYAQVQADYAVMPVFVWQTPAAPRSFESRELDEFWNHVEVDILESHDTLPKYAAFIAHKLKRLAQVWLVPAPVALLLAASLCGWVPGPLPLLLVAFVLGITLPVNADPFEYYSAPGAGLFFAVMILAFKRAWQWRGKTGRAAACAIALWCLAHSAFVYYDYIRAVDVSWSRQKEKVRDWILEQSPGKNLVLVRYVPGHSVHQEWVYNDADRDASGVIWARSLSPAEDQALCAYYPDRSVWSLEVGAYPMKLALTRPAR